MENIKNLINLYQKRIDKLSEYINSQIKITCDMYQLDRAMIERSTLKSVLEDLKEYSIQ